MFKRALLFLLVFGSISSCKKNSTSTNQDLETYNLNIQILEDYTFSNPINSIHPISPSLKFKAPLDGRTFTVLNGGVSKEFSYKDSLVASEDGIGIEWEGTNSPITITVPPTSRTENGTVVFSENLEEGKEYSINPVVQVSKIETAAFIVKFTSANGDDDLIQSAHIQKNEDWIPMLKEASCLNEINEHYQTNYSFFVALSDLNLDETLTLKLTNTFGEDQLAEITTAVLPFGRFSDNNVLEKTSSNDCSSDSLLVNSLEINLDELSFAPFYTYNFKIILNRVYNYSKPINGQTQLINPLPFNGQIFYLSDSFQEEEFKYDLPNEIWERNDSPGIRIKWTSPFNEFKISTSVPKGNFNNSEISSSQIEHYDNNNFHLNINLTQHKIDTAAFVLSIPKSLLITESEFEKLSSFEILRTNNEWVQMSTNNECFEQIKEYNTNYKFIITLTNLDLQEDLTFKLKNSNGLAYEFIRNISVLPYHNGFYGGDPSYPFNCYNSITLNEVELDFYEFLEKTQLPRTESYFPLPIIGDTLKYTHSRREEGSGTSEYDFFLLPISISTTADTMITYERHITWIPSGYGGSRLDSADIDTVTIFIKNRIINSLSLFPEVESTANGFNTYYPSDLENPHTETIYLEPNSGQPPFNYTEITVSKKKGITEINRLIQYSYNSSGRLYYTYSLQDN